LAATRELQIAGGAQHSAMDDTPIALQATARTVDARREGYPR
jgi:hypothetical protein